jgi:hypothetical protein
MSIDSAKKLIKYIRKVGKYGRGRNFSKYFA